jgi:putative flippase GtrA
MTDGDVSCIGGLRKLLPVLTYSVIGVFNTLIDFTLFSVLCLACQVPAWQANVVSYSTAVIFSFFANRRFTFRSASGSRSRTIDQFGRFLAVSLMGLTASSLITYFLSPSIGPLLAKAVAIPVTLVLGFTITRLWVFPAKAVSPPSPMRDEARV